ncbi:polymerase [Limosilactobacillus vaginalis]|uniref:polymerase n=1 Tax=Limosilactobacillus vaginalis TaxID=1633 RepID=UPI0024BB6C3F|nr:polymerase [Limosilactobacillus vaginalis]MDM8261051.1 polymerase [Limosilactobacillus vaginalis]
MEGRHLKLKEKWLSFYNSSIDAQSLYLMSFFAVFFMEFLLNSTFIPYIPMNVVTWAVYPFILPAIFKLYFLDDYGALEKVGITIVLLLALISWRKTQSNRLLLMLILIFSAKNVNFNLLIKAYFKVIVSLIIAVMIFSLLGFIDNLTYYRNSIARHSFGIDYPTDFAAYVFSAILAYCYVYFKKLNYLHYILIIIIALLVNYFTNARLDTIVIILVVPIMIIAKRAQNGKKVSKIIAAHFWTVYPLLSFIAIYATYFFDPTNKIYRFANNLLSGRLYYGKLAFQKYGFSIFGQNVIERGWGSSTGHKLMNSISAGNYFYIDSSYIRLAVIYGVIMLILLLFIVLVISIRETSLSEYILPGILLLLSISALIDQHFLEVACNPYLVALLSTINRRNLKNENI